MSRQLEYPSLRKISSLWPPQILQMHLRMKTAGLSDYIVIGSYINCVARIMESDVLYSYKTVQLTLYSISSSIMRGAAEVEFVGAIVSNCVEMRFPAYRLA